MVNKKTVGYMPKKYKQVDKLTGRRERKKE